MQRKNHKNFLDVAVTPAWPLYVFFAFALLLFAKFEGKKNLIWTASNVIKDGTNQHFFSANRHAGTVSQAFRITETAFPIAFTNYFIYEVSCFHLRKRKTLFVLLLSHAHWSPEALLHANVC